MWTTLWGYFWSWQVAGGVGLSLIGIGVGVLSMTPPQYSLAQGFVSIGLLLVLCSVAASLYPLVLSFNRGPRLLASLLVFGLVGFAWIESIRWIQRTEGEQRQADGKSEQTTPAQTSNPITIIPRLPSQKKPFPIQFEVTTTREIRSINSEVIVGQIVYDNFDTEADNRISPLFFDEQLLPGRVLLHNTTNNPIQSGSLVRSAIITIAIDFYIPSLVGTWFAAQQFRLDQERVGNQPPIRMRWEPISPVKFGRKDQKSE